MKRKIFSVLLALVLVLSFSLVMAVPAAAQTTRNVIPFKLAHTGSGTADWSMVDEYSGSSSVLLSDGGVAGNAGTVEFTVNIPLADITDLSFWFNHSTPDAAFDNFIPALSLHLDTADDGVQDAAVALNADTAGTPLFAEGEWDQWTLAEWDNWHDSTGEWEMTLADAKAKFPTAMVLHVMVGEGGWDDGTGTWEPSMAYVDDIAITTADGTTTYDLEGTATDYTVIQTAIDDSSAGDTITVAAGIYVENVNVDESLTLTGASSATVTVIAADSSAHVFFVTANSVDISGFTVSGATVGGRAGIYLNAGVSLCNIHDNILTSNFDGIWLGAGSSSNTLTNNTLTNNYQGFEVYISNNNTFTSNIASSNDNYGFKIDSGDGNEFTGNTANSNTKFGFYVVTGDGGGVSNTTFTGNTANLNTTYGIRINGGSGTTLTSNTFDSNGVSGIRLKETMTTLTLENNSFTNNPIGIEITDSVDDVSTWTVNYNNIVGNTSYGISNAAVAGTLDATNNYWGDASGPTHVSNGLGTGDAVSDYVDFIPWLDAEGGGAVYLVYIGTQGYDTIQDAVTDAAPDAVITIAPGEYTLDIIISEDMTLVSSGGAEVTKITGTGGTDPVVTIGDFTVTLNGFEIDPGDEGVYIYDISAGNVVTIENSIIHGNAHQGIWVEGTVLGTLNILNNVIANNGWEGILINEVDDGGIVVIQGNAVGAWEDADYDFSGNGNEGIQFNKVLNGSTVTIGGATEVEYNIIADNGDEGIYVNQLYYGSTLTIAGNIIGAFAYDGYIFDGNVDDGININSVNYGSTVTIADNVIAENGSNGVYIYEVGYDGTTETEAAYYTRFGEYGANTVTIERNMIGDWEYEGYSFGGNSSAGIYIEYADFASALTIQYNIMSGNLGHGIELDYLGYSGEGFYVDAVGDPLTAEPTTSNISVNPDYLGYLGPVVLIKGNTITDNADYGIYQYDAWEYGTSVTIEGNTISGNWDGGFYDADYVQYYASVTFRGNTITSNGVDDGWGGIYYADAEYAGSITIEGNLIAGNFGPGIYSSYVYDESSLIIRGNTIGAGTDAEGNVYAGNTEEGIYLYDVSLYSTAEISRNTINGNGYAGGYEGIYIYEVYDYGSVDITSNDILENRKKGITVYAVYGYGSVGIHYNNLIGNDASGNDLGVKYEYGALSDEMVNASYNWWGDISGPGRQGPGTGDGVSDYVVFSPWLSSLAVWEIKAELVADWNTFSTPITLDSGYNELAELNLDMDIAYGFYGGDWVLITDTNDTLVPSDVFYIKMNSSATVSLVPSEEKSDPSSKTLDEGWNLVSLANLSDMAAEDALASAFWVSGDLRGYSQVASPAVNETTWSAVRGLFISTALGYDMIPTEGYWVFMINAGTLAGFTSTPITLY